MSDFREILRFYIRCAPNSIDEQIARFLSEDVPELKRERVLEALRAFWLPFALEHCARSNEEEIEKIAFRSACYLEAKAAYIRKCFNLEPSISNHALVERDRSFNGVGSIWYFGMAKSNGRTQRSKRCYRTHLRSF